MLNSPPQISLSKITRDFYTIIKTDEIDNMIICSKYIIILLYHYLFLHFPTFPVLSSNLFMTLIPYELKSKVIA